MADFRDVMEDGRPRRSLQGLCKDGRGLPSSIERECVVVYNLGFRL